MPTIAAICTAAKLDRSAYNTLLASKRTASWGDEKSEGFTLRLGLFAAFKAVGFLTPAAVDYADSLASKRAIPRWYVGNPLDREEQFTSAPIEKSPLGSLLGMVDSGEGEWVAEDEPVRPSVVAPAKALVVLDLHSVRDRMLALFTK